jgi:serine/threonine protein kinase
LGKPLSERGYVSGDETALSPDLRDLYDILDGVITYDAKGRLSFDQILSHPFFSEAKIPDI